MAEAAEGRRREAQALRSCAAGVPERYLGLDHSMAGELALAMEDGQWLYLWGDVGTRKTTCAAAVAMRLARPGQVARSWCRCTACSTRFSAASTTAVTRLKRYAEAGYLLIDDLGKRRPTGFVLDSLFQLIDQALLGDAPHAGHHAVQARATSCAGSPSRATPTRPRPSCRGCATGQGWSSSTARTGGSHDARKQASCRGWPKRARRAVRKATPRGALHGQALVRADLQDALLRLRQARDQSCHHVAHRSLGLEFELVTPNGTWSLRSPLFALCGSGTTGCHGQFHGGAGLRAEWRWRHPRCTRRRGGRASCWRCTSRTTRGCTSTAYWAITRTGHGNEIDPRREMTMEIETCEQYVLAQLFEQQDENDRLCRELQRRDERIDELTGQIDAIEAAPGSRVAAGDPQGAGRDALHEPAARATRASVER